MSSPEGREATMSGGPSDMGPAAGPHDAPLKLEEFLPYRLNVVANLVSQPVHAMPPWTCLSARKRE